MDNTIRYSDWKYVIDGHNRKFLYYCPSCERNTAALMKRYVTDRNDERSEQFRVQCQVCEETGKTYQNKFVAVQSWSGQEHRPKPPAPKRKNPNE